MSEEIGESVKEKVEPLKCGIVMPISAIDGCPSSHWDDVRKIIQETAEIVGYQAELVSESDDVGIIHSRIVQNLHDLDIIVCDVSAKNANVMFELGLRLAFDKPAIVVKDDKTDYSFDTSPIEHIEYPRDLRHPTMQDFKKLLAAKIEATVEASKKEEYQSFLKHFGKFEVAGLSSKTVSKDEFIVRELQEIRRENRELKNVVTHAQRREPSLYSELFDHHREGEVYINTPSLTEQVREYVNQIISKHPVKNVGPLSWVIQNTGSDRGEISVNGKFDAKKAEEIYYYIKSKISMFV